MIHSRPLRLYLLRLSLARVPSGDRTLEMALGCYLVEMSDGRRVLIDSGYPADLPPPPGASNTEPSTDVIEQLAALGLRADDVDLLICTHFDVDHVGYHDAFTRAELVVQR